MKRKKRIISLLCLVLGMVLLIGAAFANYGNANGYQLYKESAKKMLYLNNYSADVELLLTYDDAVMGRYIYRAQFNDKADVTSATETSEVTYALDGTELSTWSDRAFYSDGVVYRQNNDNQWYANRTRSNGLMSESIFGSGETKDKTVRFVELLADVFVGDLKNNFALVKSEDGLDYYEVNLAGQQIPELVNAGLALIFTAEHNASGAESYVTTSYDFEWTDEDESYLWDEAEELRREEGGIIVIENDRTFSHYESYEEYRLSRIENKTASELDFDDMIYTMGTEPTIGIASSHFTLDEEGRLRDNTLVGTMVGTDSEGNEHTMGITVNIKLYDYDMTEPQPFIDPDRVPIEEYDGYYETTSADVAVPEAAEIEPAEPTSSVTVRVE